MNEVWPSSTYDFSNHVEFDWVNLICYAFISFIYKKKKLFMSPFVTPRICSHNEAQTNKSRTSYM
jgi:hypothetical protein